MHIENKGFKLQTCVDVQIYSYSNSSNVQYQCSSIQWRRQVASFYISDDKQDKQRGVNLGKKSHVSSVDKKSLKYWNRDCSGERESLLIDSFRQSWSFRALDSLISKENEGRPRLFERGDTDAIDGVENPRFGLYGDKTKPEMPHAPRQPRHADPFTGHERNTEIRFHL